MASGLMRCQRPLFLSALLIYAAMQKISAITSDGEALLSFKTSIVGSDGIFQQWRQEDSDPCIWSGVTCDNHTRRVICLNLSYHKLIGSISPDIGKLSKLKLLALHGNSLYGYIPPEIGNCTELQHVDLSSNTLSGSIPISLGRLTKLTELLGIHPIIFFFCRQF